MTESDRISYLNFCCGMMLGTLVASRDGVMDPSIRARIDSCLEMVNPLMERVYEFQAQEKP